MKKHLGLLTVLAVIALTVFFYFRFFFVFGEGVKSGELNYVVYKGVLFKTYEGKLIQTGIRSKEAGSIQSYEFEFSVEDPALARELMLQGGRTLELHYKEYFGALPWRGFTKFIVDSIVTIGPPVRRGVELPPVQSQRPNWQTNDRRDTATVSRLYFTKAGATDGDYFPPSRMRACVIAASVTSLPESILAISVVRSSGVRRAICVSPSRL